MEFKGFPKLARLNREIVITEKIDGTNAQVYIKQRCSCESIGVGAACSECPTAGQAIARSEDLIMFAGSRTRWITPEEDNYGFAKWVKANAEELFHLGPGQHFGEWWGQGIQRRYDLNAKRFSLFNTGRWADRHWGADLYLGNAAPHRLQEGQTWAPPCCHVVPVLYKGMFSPTVVAWRLAELQERGSIAAPGFMQPEGVVIYHTAANSMFKVTLEGDGVPKSLRNAS